MRKLLLCITLLSALLTVSCKKEDNSPTTNNTNTNTSQGNIVGTWTWTDTYTPDGNGNYTIHWTGPQQPTGKQITYSSNGTYTSDWNFPQMGIPGASNPDNGTYTNADSLIMTSSVTSLQVRAKVTKLTSNELWFRYNGNENYELHFTK